MGFNVWHYFLPRFGGSSCIVFTHPAPHSISSVSRAIIMCFMGYSSPYYCNTQCSPHLAAHYSFRSRYVPATNYPSHIAHIRPVHQCSCPTRSVSGFWLCCPAGIRRTTMRFELLFLLCLTWLIWLSARQRTRILSNSAVL